MPGVDDSAHRSRDQAHGGGAAHRHFGRARYARGLGIHNQLDLFGQVQPRAPTGPRVVAQWQGIAHPHLLHWLGLLVFAILRNYYNAFKTNFGAHSLTKTNYLLQYQSLKE